MCSTSKKQTWQCDGGRELLQIGFSALYSMYVYMYVWYMHDCICLPLKNNSNKENHLSTIFRSNTIPSDLHSFSCNCNSIPENKYFVPKRNLRSLKYICLRLSSLLVKSMIYELESDSKFYSFYSAAFFGPVFRNLGSRHSTNKYRECDTEGSQKNRKFCS